MLSNTKGILSACITAILWGFLAIAMKVALNHLPPLTIIWFRFALAALLLFIYFLIKKPSKLSIIKTFPLLLLIASICLGFNYLGFVYSLFYTSPSTTQVVIQMGPILLAISGIIFFRERVFKIQLLGFLIATIGLVLFYYNHLAGFSRENYNKGFLWVVFAAVSWTIYAILQKKLVQKHDPQLLNLFIYAIPAIMLTPTANFESFSTLNINQWILLIFLGLNTLVAYGFLAIAFKHTQAYKVSIIIILNPIITLVCMNLLYYFQADWLKGEQLSPLAMLGAVLLLGGAILAVLYAPRTNKNESQTKRS